MGGGEDMGGLADSQGLVKVSTPKNLPDKRGDKWWVRKKNILQTKSFVNLKSNLALKSSKAPIY